MHTYEFSNKSPARLQSSGIVRFRLLEAHLQWRTVYVKMLSAPVWQSLIVPETRFQTAVLLPPDIFRQ